MYKRQFHANEADLDIYYEKAKGAYKKIFSRVGLVAVETRAAGGTFSAYSDEYQVVCETGEDEIIYCPGGDFSENTEISKIQEGKQCDLGHGPLLKVRSIEVGNIFPIKDKYSKAFDLTYATKSGEQKLVQMGCYGIGISRLMGAIVEVMHDDAGITWPKSVSPYDVHMVHIEDPGTEPWAKEVFDKLTKAGLDVLWDDRESVSAGEKFADCDLIGIPTRLVVSKKVGKGKVEIKSRGKEKVETLFIDAAIKSLSK